MKKDEEVSLYAISVDPPDVSREFTKRIAADGKGEVGFSVLSDPEHRTIDRYGLRDPAYEGQKVYGIPYPAVYVIDEMGTVAWAKVELNYQERPMTEDIRRALDALK